MWAQQQLWNGPLPGLTLSGVFGGVFGQDRLYAVTLSRQPGRCGAGLYGTGMSKTLEGTPRELLPASERRAAIEFVTIGPEIQRPIVAVAGQARVGIRNTGSRVWPALAAGDTALVKLSYRWLDANGEPLPDPNQPISTRLPADLLPGEVIALPIAFRLPASRGSYRFQVLLDQGPQAPFELTGPGADPVSVNIR